MSSGCKEPQKIYYVRLVATHEIIHRLVGVKTKDLMKVATSLTGYPAYALLIEDSGKTKPCCKDCG